MELLTNGCLRQLPEAGICYAAGSDEAVGCLDGVEVRADGQKLEWKEAAFLERKLNQKKGLWLYSATASIPEGNVRLSAECFVSMAQKELLAVRYELESDTDVHMELKPFLSAGNPKVWERRAEEEGEDGPAILLRSKENGLAVAAAMSCWADGLELESRQLEEGYAGSVYSAEVPAGEKVSLEKCVLVFTSRDYEEKALTTIALRAASRARELGYDELRADHISAWRARWRNCDAVIEGDEKVQQEIDSCIYDLIGNFAMEEPEMRNAGCEMAARCLSACLSFAGKEAARQMLLGYYDQLEAAYENARSRGVLGAMYPMQNGHPGALIAYSIFDYATATGDYDFMLAEGLDVLCGVARFYTDRAGFDEEEEKYVIEYTDEHDAAQTGGWYLNRLAAWSIGLFITRARRAAQERLDELGVTKEELAYMLDVMQHLDAPEAAFVGNPDQDSPTEVLHGLYYLRHLYDAAVISQSVEQYAPSVVQPDALCCAAAAQAGKPDLALEWLHQLQPKTIEEKAEYWQALVHGFAGLQTTDDLVLNPVLPDAWKEYSLRFGCRGRVISLTVNRDQVCVELLDGAPVDVSLYGTTQRLTSQLVHVR